MINVIDKTGSKAVSKTFNKMEHDMTKAVTSQDFGWPEIAVRANSGSEHAHQSALFQYLAMLNAVYSGNDEVRLKSTDGWFLHNGERAFFGPGDCGRLNALFAIPNGGVRDKITAARLKAEGVKAGVPDVMFPYPVKREILYGKVGSGSFRKMECHALFIEMKKPKTDGKKKGVVSDNQSKWHDYLSRQGYRVVVCYSVLEACEALWNYLYSTKAEDWG